MDGQPWSYPNWTMVDHGHFKYTMVNYALAWLSMVSHGHILTEPWLTLWCGWGCTFQGDILTRNTIGWTESQGLYFRYWSLATLIWWYTSSVSISHLLVIYWCVGHLFWINRNRSIGALSASLQEHKRQTWQCRICQLTSRNMQLKL